MNKTQIRPSTEYSTPAWALGSRHVHRCVLLFGLVCFLCLMAYQPIRLFNANTFLLEEQ